MIISFNFYYARPGNEDAVLRQRQRASDVRERLGIPRGRIMRRITGAATLPDVIWELQFAEIADHHADMRIRAESPEFEAVRAGMRTLSRRFERPLFDICADTLASPSRGSKIVTLDWVFCMPDRTQALADNLQHNALDGTPGRLLRLTTPGHDVPELVWQREYVDAARAAARAPFTTEAIGPDRIETSAWEVVQASSGATN